MDDCVDESESLLSPRNLRLAKRDLDLLAKKDTNKESMEKKEVIESRTKITSDDTKEAQAEEEQKEEGILDQMIRRLPISAIEDVAPPTEEATLLIATIIHE